MNNLPDLYHKDKHGRIRLWRVWSEGKTIYTEYGLLDGELQISSKDAEPTNVGRSNERNHEQQATFEAQSMWNFKRERKYSDTPDGAEIPLVLPMLAKKYSKGDLTNSYIQKKYDGNRMMCYKDEDGKVVLVSRSGKPYKVNHIEQALIHDLPSGYMFDGELYCHGLSLQTITSLVKKQQPESLQLEYHIYDVPVVDGDDTLEFKDRLAALNNLQFRSKFLKKVETNPVANIIEARKAEAEFVAQGYEGAIVREASGVYKFGYRSSQLLKLKSFLDGEFTVVDAKQGVGKMKGCAVFVCQNDLTDATFDVVPACTMEERAYFWEHREDYFGKPYTIRYFNRTDSNIPFLPVGVAFRDEKDL